MVSSREIAASSMQLVMASRVKAEPGSAALAALNTAAKTISTLAGTLVATAENARDQVASDDLDFSSLSLHQTKRLEMDALVKVLEAEKKLEEQREKLAHLRRHHYQMAGQVRAGGGAGEGGWWGKKGQVGKVRAGGRGGIAMSLPPMRAGGKTRTTGRSDAHGETRLLLSLAR
ncbi:hypothetical protein HAZT_HAZT000324 [Hyalella azteca]|uniref:I/LWEQ domain-containing protein n=1 Tax=Hyalella azteca TaxID=294128 RepID=A0A6A0HEI7_HYAAZ|nr:hypothetical protein HAZT_HAZT000324 [Hyalella azteca]